MDDEETPKDPKDFAYLSSAGPRHNIFLTFTDAHGKRIFDIDSCPTSDPDQYRHRISLRFSRLDSTIYIRESFATVHDGKEFHAKVAESNDQMRVIGSLVLPGASFVVERGEQESKPWPDPTNNFVIELGFLQTSGGIPRDHLTFKHIGQTTKLEAECGELGLRKHLKSLKDVKGVSICVEDYRWNKDFDQDDVREVLLPRFGSGGRRQEARVGREAAREGGVSSSEVAGESFVQRILRGPGSDASRRRTRKRKAREQMSRVKVNTEVVDSLRIREGETGNDKVDGEESGMMSVEQQSGIVKRARVDGDVRESEG
jgi:hypothetical protein